MTYKDNIIKEIKKILKTNLIKDIIKEGQYIQCPFCEEWQPSFHAEAGLMTHLAHNHKGQYKTKIDKIMDIFDKVLQEVEQEVREETRHRALEFAEPFMDTTNLIEFDRFLFNLEEEKK